MPEEVNLVTADHLSALLTIDRSKFYAPAGVLQNYCDGAKLSNCWVTVTSRTETLLSGWSK